MVSEDVQTRLRELRSAFMALADASQMSVQDLLQEGILVEDKELAVAARRLPRAKGSLVLMPLPSEVGTLRNCQSIGCLTPTRSETSTRSTRGVITPRSVRTAGRKYSPAPPMLPPTNTPRRKREALEEHGHDTFSTATPSVQTCQAQCAFDSMVRLCDQDDLSPPRQVIFDCLADDGTNMTEMLEAELGYSESSACSVVSEPRSEFCRYSGLLVCSMNIDEATEP